MERGIKTKVGVHIQEFKDSLQSWIDNNNASIMVNGENKLSEFVQYLNDFPNLELTKEDFQKRRRIKNNVPDYNRCIALKCNGDRCSRKQKHENTTFCGTHMKGSPYGTVEMKNIQPKKQKVQLWLQEINGISRYIDAEYNVYSSEDIINSQAMPRVIGTYGINEMTGEYFLVLP